jgi:hypothetical protein
MNLRKFYSPIQKEGIIIAKNNKIQIPKVKLAEFFDLFHKTGLPKIEKLAKILLLNKAELKKYISKLINFFANQPGNFINQFYNLLTPKEKFNGINGSVIFIYGTGKSPARAIFGAEIYKKQKIPIIMSGKKEVENSKKILIKNGVLERDIFEEKQGRNFIENAYYSIRLAKEKGFPLDKIILVSASLVALRAFLTTQIFLPKETIIYSLPVEYDPTNPNDPTSPENWYKNNLGIEVFLSEIIKLYIMKKEKLLK